MKLYVISLLLCQCNCCINFDATTYRLIEVFFPFIILSASADIKSFSIITLIDVTGVYRMEEQLTELMDS